MKKLICLVLLFTGCATFHFRIVGWYNEDTNVLALENGKIINVLGNPRITCYSKKGSVIANGLFVTVRGNFLIVDEFGKKYVWLENNNLGNYCRLWEQQ